MSTSGTAAPPRRRPRFRLRTLLGLLAGLSLLCVALFRFCPLRAPHFEVCRRCGALRSHGTYDLPLVSLASIPRVQETGATRFVRTHYGIECRTHDWTEAAMECVNEDGWESSEFVSRWDEDVRPFLEALAQSHPRDTRALVTLLVDWQTEHHLSFILLVRSVGRSRKPVTPERFFSLLDDACDEAFHITWEELRTATEGTIAREQGK